MADDTKSHFFAPRAAPGKNGAGQGTARVRSAMRADLKWPILWLIGLRALILLVVVNLANPVGLLPARFGDYPFLPFFNILTLTFALLYLALWWQGNALTKQLWLQAASDLVMATVLVSQTGGIESIFVSFYLLIIIYCSLLLGHQGGMIAAALSTIVYSGIVAADYLGFLAQGSRFLGLKYLTYRIALNAGGFFAIGLLGTYLYHRLQLVQKQLEEKIITLEELQRLNEHIVGSIRSGLITADLEGRIAVFNNTASELLEADRSSAPQKTVALVLGEPLWQKMLQEDFFQDDRPLRHEDWFSFSSGCKRYLGFSVSPLIDQEKKQLGYVISFQDLTEIKRLEAEILVKDRLASIGRMAAGIAHEIRNPLTSMRGSVEILRSRLELGKGDERLFDILIRESDRLNKFVEDFLKFARPGNHTHERVDIAGFLRDFVTLLQNSPDVRDKHPVNLQIDSSPIYIQGNGDQLRQVFWNLAQNALRAMPNGGQLTVLARKSGEGGSQVLFQDEGIGMSPDEVSRLFQPFQAGFKGGTGLGLSIIYQIMEDHRGKIYLESQKDRGTTVTLVFPPETESRHAGL
jgi:two-component system, NtrC family, sensor histidine kinase PilS